MWATAARARVSAATRTVWQKIESPVHVLSRAFNRVTLVVIYLVAGFAIALLAYHFQHEGFTPPTIPGQVYVSVFEQNPAAELQLTASINAKDPGADTVTVTDLKGNPGRWLIIIECPSQVSETGGNAPATNAALYTETPLQIQLVPAAPSAADKPSQVIEQLGKPLRPGKESHALNLGCFTSQTGSSSIGNVALPALGTDQAITTEPVDIQGLPELYAGNHVLVESIGNPPCPGSTASTGAGPSPDTGPSGTVAGSSSASPSGTASATTSVVPATTATPSPSVPPSGSDTPPGSESPSATAPSGPQSPACFFQSPPTVSPVDYFLPTTLTTKETVTQVNLSGGWVLQSQFPTGTTDNNTITWEGAAGLSPDIHADNPSADSNSNHATFLSGILWGVVGGAGVSLVDHLERVNSEHRKRKDEQTNKDEQTKKCESGAHPAIPTAEDVTADHAGTST